MFTAQQYRAKAIEYSNLVRIASGTNETREFQRLERSSTEIADNAQWVTDNGNKMVSLCRVPGSSGDQRIY